MPAPWGEIHARLVEASRSLIAADAFTALQRDLWGCSRFCSASELVALLGGTAMDPVEKSRIYGGLIAQARRPGMVGRLATCLVWLGLWPGLDAVYRRQLRFWNGRTSELASEIGERLTQIIQQIEIPRHGRVVAVMIDRTERAVIEANRRELARESRFKLMADPTTPPPVVPGRKPEPPESTPEPVPVQVADLRRMLRTVLIEDADLLVAVFVCEEDYRALARRFGETPEAVRTRVMRAVVRVRHALGFEKNRRE